MKTYLVKSWTNYGERVHIINAENEEDVKNIAEACDQVLSGYEIEEVDTEQRGIVAVAGGGGG